VRFFVFHFILRSELMRFVRARRFRLHRIDEAFFVQQQLAQRSTLALFAHNKVKSEKMKILISPRFPLRHSFRLPPLPPAARAP